MRLKSIRLNDKARFVCLVIAFVAGVLFCENIGFLEGIDNYFYDLAFRLRGERKHDDRIVIAAIDEKTLAKLGRWPIRRTYYVALLNHFQQQAAAVGLNIIFSESSADDKLLADAIDRQGNVVLPVYIDSHLNISAPVAALSAAACGHVHLAQDVDGFVREMFHTVAYRSGVLPSFAFALRDVLDAKMPARPDIRDEISPTENLYPIVQSDNMWINYYGAPGTFHYLSVADILDGQWPPSFFADKIVLVGKTTAGLQEGILTPFTHDRSKMPAVEVHAHALNNLLDHSRIRPVGRWIRWTVATGFAIFCFFMFIRSSIVNGTFIGLLSLSAVTLVIMIAFARFNVWLMPAALYASVGVSFLAAYFYNLQKMKSLLLRARDNWEESFNTIDDAICIYDDTCNLIQCNRAAEQIFGPPGLEFLKQRCSRHYLENDAVIIENARTKVEGFTEEVFHSELGRYLEIKSHPRFDRDRSCKGVVQVVRDITENKISEKEHRRLQEQLIQAQKMEAIGTLAGGIAHDFNNILSAVMGYTELALLSLPERTELTVHLNHVLKAGMRAKDLVEQILAFSRQTHQVYQQQSVRIGLIIKEALKLIQSTFPSTIQLDLKIVSKSMVVIDPSQMHQIVMNLCTNAKHAMQEHGGMLTVNLVDVEIEPPAEILDRNPELRSGSYVRLTVKDTGHGMSPEVMQRIFEPYFTTKEKDVGTGLGLAMVHGITKKFGGTVLLESQPGKGTAFYVYLPRENVDPAPQPAEEKSAVQAAPAGSERILLVDDELELLSLGRDALERLGYQVVTTNNGIDALKEFSARPNYFDAVITDMTMPGMTGEKLAHKLIGIRPDIPVIICTGFSEQMDAQKAKALGIQAFLMKPLTLNHLAETLRTVLDSKD
jgi:PAS domain S-box-containing protein